MDDLVRETALGTLDGSVKADPAALSIIRPYVESFLDQDLLGRALSAFDIWVKRESDPGFVSRYFDKPLNSNPFIALLWAARYAEHEWQTDGWATLSPVAERLFGIGIGLAFAEMHESSLMDRAARRAVRRRLQADVQNLDDAWSFIQECETYATFVRWQMDPIPVFLIPSHPRIDIEMRTDGYHIPVSCKAKMPGTGRFMSRDMFVRLAASIARKMHDAGRKQAVHIYVARDLTCDDIEPISQRVRQLPERAPKVLFTHDSRLFVIDSSPLHGTFTRDGVEQYLGRYEHFVGMVIGDPTQSVESQTAAALIGVYANPTEEPQHTLRTTLSDAAGDISKTGQRGFASIHYFDAQPLFPQGEAEQHVPPWMVRLLNDVFAQHQKLAGVMISTEANVTVGGGAAPMRVRVALRDSLPKDFPYREMRSVA